MCSLFVIGEICADPPRHHHDERLISHVHPIAAANRFIRGVPCERAVGFLHTASPSPYARLVEAYLQGLKETGYIEGQNVRIEYRWAEGHFDRLPELADELIRDRVALIAALGGSNSTLAAKKATSTIPIVFSSGEVDPVKSGLVSSLNKPGGKCHGHKSYDQLVDCKTIRITSRGCTPKLR